MGSAMRCIVEIGIMDIHVFSWMRKVKRLPENSLKTVRIYGDTISPKIRLISLENWKST